MNCTIMQPNTQTKVSEFFKISDEIKTKHALMQQEVLDRLDEVEAILEKPIFRKAVIKKNETLRLSDEVLVEILSFLPISDISKSLLVCRRFNRLEPILSRLVLEKKYPDLSGVLKNLSLETRIALSRNAILLDKIGVDIEALEHAQKTTQKLLLSAFIALTPTAIPMTSTLIGLGKSYFMGACLEYIKQNPGATMEQARQALITRYEAGAILAGGAAIVYQGSKNQ